MRLSRDTRNAYVAMAACVLGGGLLRLLSDRRFFDIYISAATFACYTCFVLVWLRLMRRRFLHPMVLSCLHGAGMLMIVWLFVRTLRYTFMGHMPGIRQIPWYLYYAFYSFIPALLFLAILHAGKREDERIDRRWWLLLAVAGALSVLFLTNDLHELAFRFPHTAEMAGVPRDSQPYTYGPLYYISWAWTALLAAGSVVASILRIGRARVSWRTSVLLIPLALGATYSLTHAFAPGVGFHGIYKVVEVICFLIVFYMECFIRLGLFSANEGYDELWRASSLHGGLMADDGTVAFSSADTPDVTVGQVREALDRPLPLGRDSELSAHAVHGGTAFWVRDLTRIHALQQQLEDLGDVLSEENAMLQAEADLAHERESIQQRNRLHEQVMEGIEPQLSAIEDLLAEVPADDDAFLDRMRHAAVRASFAKRYANLTLSGEAGTVDARELGLAIAEVAEWLRSCGIEASADDSYAGALPTEEALGMLRAFVDDAVGEGGLG